MTPNEVNAQNSKQLHRRLFGAKKPKLIWAFETGDTVRIIQAKRAFRKGYTPLWCDEIFFIESRHPTDPPTYKIKDYDGEVIRGKFYKQELQRIKSTSDTFKIEKILKTRKVKGVKEYLVKWRGYPDKFNSWTRDIIRNDG